MAELSSRTPDCVIFDLDGVLVSGVTCFKSVVSRSLPLYWSDIMGREADCAPDCSEYYMTAKRYGSYNNDYDLAWVLFSLTAETGKEKLSEAFPSPDKWRSTLDAAGTDGMSYFRRRFGSLIDRQILRGVCTEVYFGSDRTNEKPHFSGLLKKPVKGSRHLERPLVSFAQDVQQEPDGWWKMLPLPVGVYSGRYWNEVSAAFDTLGWKNFPEERIVSFEMCKKPDPTGIRLLCDRLGGTYPLYLGDAESDHQTMQNFGGGVFAAIGPLLAQCPLHFDNAAEALHTLLGMNCASVSDA